MANNTVYALQINDHAPTFVDILNYKVTAWLLKLLKYKV